MLCECVAVLRGQTAALSRKTNAIKCNAFGPLAVSRGSDLSTRLPLGTNPAQLSVIRAAQRIDDARAPVASDGPHVVAVVLGFYKYDASKINSGCQPKTWKRRFARHADGFGARTTHRRGRQRSWFVVTRRLIVPSHALSAARRPMTDEVIPTAEHAREPGIPCGSRRRTAPELGSPGRTCRLVRRGQRSCTHPMHPTST